MGRSAGMDGMMVVSRAVYAVAAELSWTLAATIIRDEHCSVSPADTLAPLVGSDWPSHRATELTLSLSTRQGLHTQLTSPTDQTLNTPACCKTKSVVTSSSARMRFKSRNWSATKQCLHPQSVAEISRHSVLSGDRIWQCETSSGSCHKDTDQCL